MTPYFTSLADFIAMGNHGVYIWTCWGLVLTVIFSLIIHARNQRTRLIQQIKKQQIKVQHARQNNQ